MVIITSELNIFFNHYYCCYHCCLIRCAHSESLSLTFFLFLRFGPNIDTMPPTAALIIWIISKCLWPSLCAELSSLPFPAASASETSQGRMICLALIGTCYAWGKGYAQAKYYYLGQHYYKLVVSDRLELKVVPEYWGEN